MAPQKVFFLRYPGGKGRMLEFLTQRLALAIQACSRLVEPFVGGGSFFFATKPKKALLSDINQELVDLYRAIRLHPTEVWETFRKLPSTKRAYYRVRGWRPAGLDLVTRAARTLYLNRTCFKGMWRHNLNGEFNIGYGGQDRRWVLSKGTIVQVSKLLRHASLRCVDFEDVIDECGDGDFIFADPPYRPGEPEMVHDHYRFGKFGFDDHRRLAAALKRARARGANWAMTTSSHPSIVAFFRGCPTESIPKGTGKQIGLSVRNSGEVLVRSHKEKPK
jgi:DNA adenine methylase